MSNLIHSPIFFDYEFTLGIHRILFEEKADFITRSQEIVVTDMVIVSCRELCLLAPNDINDISTMRKQL